MSSDRTLLTAWLLLLLDRESHGWALVGALHERGLHVNLSYAYRKLRELEHDDAVASRWTKSDGGPPRRSYRLTPSGHRMLAELIAPISARREQYSTFLRAHERAEATPDTLSPENARGSQRPQDAGHPADHPHQHASDEPAPRRDTSAPSPTNAVIAAWMLLLLERGACHGYGLGRWLGEQRINVDAAGTYRLLRKLDDAGCVRSHWREPNAGPRARLYHLTTQGRRHRHRLAHEITNMRDSHTAFLDAYEHRAT